MLSSSLSPNHSKLLQISINLAPEVVNQISKCIGVWRSNNDFPKIIDSSSMVDVSQHAIISFSVKTLAKALGGSVPSTNFDPWCYIIWYCTIQVRLYFRKIKRPGIGRFVENCLFPKNVFLNLNLNCQNNFYYRRFDLHLPFWIIQVPFCQTKVPFSMSDEHFFQKYFNSVIFISNKQLFIFITYFAHLFYEVWYTKTYMI